MADKIVIDLNNITRPQFLQFKVNISKAKTEEERSKITGELVEIVVKSWPYDQPITPVGYNSLGLLDALEVDNSLLDAMEDINSKNSARRSISPANSAPQ